MPGGLSLVGCLVNVMQGSKETAQWHMEVSKLGGCALRGGAADDTPLYWGTLAAHCKFHSQLTIFQRRLEGVRKRGLAPHQFWWEQPLDREVTGLLANVQIADGLSDDGD